jgi:hypothetical protein
MDTGVSLPGDKATGAWSSPLTSISCLHGRLKNIFALTFPVSLCLIRDEQRTFLEQLCCGFDHTAMLHICRIHVGHSTVNVSVVNTRGWIVEAGDWWGTGVGRRVSWRDILYQVISPVYQWNPVLLGLSALALELVTVITKHNRETWRLCGIVRSHRMNLECRGYIRT